MKRADPIRIGTREYNSVSMDKINIISAHVFYRIHNLLRKNVVY